MVTSPLGPPSRPLGGNRDVARLHRLAMSFGVLGSLLPACGFSSRLVAKTYPNYTWLDWATRPRAPRLAPKNCYVRCMLLHGIGPQSCCLCFLLSGLGGVCPGAANPARGPSARRDVDYFAGLVNPGQLPNSLRSLAPMCSRLATTFAGGDIHLLVQISLHIPAIRKRRRFSSPLPRPSHRTHQSMREAAVRSRRSSRVRLDYMSAGVMIVPRRNCAACWVSGAVPRPAVLRAPAGVVNDASKRDLARRLSSVAGIARREAT